MSASSPRRKPRSGQSGELVARNGTQSGHRAFDDARENPTGVTVKGVARVLFEPSNAVLLLEIVHGRGQRARCFPAEHPQMHQRLRIEFARLQSPDLIEYFA